MSGGRILETCQAEVKGKGLTDLQAQLPTIPVTWWVNFLLFTPSPVLVIRWTQAMMRVTEQDLQNYRVRTLWLLQCLTARPHLCETWPPNALKNVTLWVTWSPLGTPCCRGGEGSLCLERCQYTPPWEIGWGQEGLFKTQKSTTQPSQPHLEAFLSRRICMQISESVCRLSLQRVLEPWHERKSRETG